MSSLPASLQELVEQFKKLPGIGAKSAQRLAFHILRTPREDTEKLNATVKDELAAKGLVLNQPDVAPFREKLRSAGFYSEWKGKYGEEAWTILEKAVGKLA